MSDPDVKLVKVDNWGIFFLQRLKHFFNRTDYCDLTLQFQDNAQLKVHRLVLSACTEYFELLERTCEMYEDCLVMPDDLQADVVVPIVNFMYTGQLEFRMDLLERLYLTSQIMNMTVLTKLLEAHRNQAVLTPVKPRSFANAKRSYSKTHIQKEVKLSEFKQVKQPAPAPFNKRSYTKAFGNITGIETKKPSISKSDMSSNNGTSVVPSPILTQPSSLIHSVKKPVVRDPRPTRYELPEELDTEDVCDNSFINISYTSQPLMVHPETAKTFKAKGASSRKLGGANSTLDIIGRQTALKKESLFEDDPLSNTDDFQTSAISSNQLFDQIVEQPGPKVTIESKDSQTSNMDHAKIISEVLKKYPHLVKGNKNIKLKILNTPTQSVKSKQKKNSSTTASTPYVKVEVPAPPDYTYESDVLDSKEAAKLIALGADNVKGPWICLICGTPGKALHFTSYYNFRKHLVDVHNEKPISNMCEYCGLKSLKRNYLLHHLLTKHNVEPPPSYNFPKCKSCGYIALTEGLMVKHKLSHNEGRSFRCSVCSAYFNTSALLLEHMKKTGHKIGPDRKDNLQCVYCLRNFLREGNLYAHLKTYHRHVAVADGIIADSDEEETKNLNVKKEKMDNNYAETETQYQIKPDGNIEVITSKRPRITQATVSPMKQKILNCAWEPEEKPQTSTPNQVHAKKISQIESQDLHEEIVMIDNKPYVMRDNELIPKNDEEYILSDMPESDIIPSTSMIYSNPQDSITDLEENVEQQAMNKATNINQPIQIVVSNEEEYKALLNSNHSIIFDDGDANKTLTVLTAPQTATMSTTGIDLNDTQSNEMMIIPENYTMNVSEGITTDNSNIVVVYSHPVDDQSKEYQIITSQDIGAQFVQTSTVIAQNFGTVTTSAPIMDAQIIDNQESESWQTNEPASGNTEIQELTNVSLIEQAEIVPMVTAPNNDSLSELPDVTLTSQVPQASEITQKEAEENFSDPDVTVNEPNQNIDAVQEDQLDTLTKINVDIPMDVDNGDNVTNKPNEDEDLECHNQDGDLEISAVPNMHEIGESPIEGAENQEEIIDSGQVDISSQECEGTVVITSNNVIITEDSISNENEPTAVNETEKKQNEDDSPQEIVEATAQVVATEIEKEQIQNLTSEWSEDEYDTEEQEATSAENQSSIEKPNDSENKEQEMEESIENIQQEMENQVHEVAENNEDTENVVTATEPAEVVHAPDPTEKISSLLNDWDENDSQEGNGSANGNEDDAVTENYTVTATENVVKDVEVVTDTQTQIVADADGTGDEYEPKNDNPIQSLVSDWDEDDEENKNVQE